MVKEKYIQLFIHAQFGGIRIMIVHKPLDTIFGKWKI